ncbi:MAG TPA: hypothetical protein VKZ53_04315 [Candidatus Angelobacter sp.]|nr:hypothetical protein [Candidatus Angelobacter sp.]
MPTSNLLTKDPTIKESASWSNSIAPARAPQTLRVLVKEGFDIQPHELLATGVTPAQGFDFPVTLRGSTSHFHVYYDPSLGASGQTIADGVLASCEREYQILSAVFGGIQVGNFNIIIAPNIPGAYHYGCSATDLYCDAVGTNTDFTRFLVVAEEVEVFSAVQGKGWNCSASNGEGLSRVLSTYLYPAQLDGFASARIWLDTPGRPDFVDSNDPTDRNAVSYGCAVLFLNYMRTQLGFSWNEIVQAGAPTMSTVYTTLTRSLDGFGQFKADLQSTFPEGHPSGIVNDNPFPIHAVPRKNTLVETAVNAPGVAELNGRTYIAWAGTDSEHRLNVLSSNHRTVWQNKVTLHDTSPVGVSICVFNGRIYLAWSGTGNQQLNVMSSPDGINWINKVTLGETSAHRPVLTVHNNELVLGWTGTDSEHHLNVLFSNDGIHWNDKHTLGETSIDSPALASFQGKLVIAWTGTDSSHRLNVSSSGDRGASWHNKVTLNETSIASPGLLAFAGQLLLSWDGTDADHHINLLRSFDAIHFASKITLNELSVYCPTLGVSYGSPSITWTGTDSGHHVNLLSV